MILSRVFSGDNTGFFVDVGAHHPMRFSNTYFFYKLGWRGINIDAIPGSMESFRRLRPGDINLEIPISNSADELVFYRFNEPALSGFSKEISESRQNLPANYYVEEEIELKTSKLSAVLDAHMPADTDIDFMSIDVEGFDFEVLQSNDWGKYRPKILLVEILHSSITNLSDSEIYLYLNTRGYDCFAKTLNTVFFRRNDFEL